MIPRNTVFTKLACLFHIIVNISFSYDLFIRKLQVLKNQMLEAHHLISSLISPVTIYRSQHSCAVTQVTSLHKIHESLCHPGITRLFHFVRAKNLPFSVEDVRKTVGNCRVCSESKPQFYTPPAASLVKATQPFERLSLDFKGPLPSTSKNHYLLTIVDEFSRFRFAFLCRSTDAKTVIECLNELFAVFGMCAYIHSNCGPAFLSKELVSYLHRRGIACSRTSVYNPRGNGQCERYNGIIWSSVKLVLKSPGLDISQWECVLPHALHSIRSLLCTATSETPHERLFHFKRRSTFGVSVPTWLSVPGPVLLRRLGRSSKYDRVVEEVDLVHATPNYAVVRFPSGKESTVSLKDIAPAGSSPENNSGEIEPPLQLSNDVHLPETYAEDGPDADDVAAGPNASDAITPDEDGQTKPVAKDTEHNVPLRRSSRLRKPVERYGAVPYS